MAGIALVLPLSGLPSPYVYEIIVSAFGDLKANNISMSHARWQRMVESNRIESEDWRLLSIRVTQTLLISSAKGGGSAPKTFKQSHRQPASALEKSDEAGAVPSHRGGDFQLQLQLQLAEPTHSIDSFSGSAAWLS